METLEKNSALQSRLLKQKRLAVQVKVVGNATPASKNRSSDLSGVVIVACQGQTSEVPSGVSITSPDDATGKFSVILDKAALGPVEKILKAELVDITATHSISAVVSSEHIVINIDSSADLSAANSELRLIIDYLKK